jgi:phospholipase/carboxylesterase
MTGQDLGFSHVFERATDPAAGTLLVLHGTGGNEHDLIPLGRLIAPGAALLSPRGKVLEAGKPRFFRRLAEGVFDVEDLKQRAAELGDFVVAAAERYTFDRRTLTAVGFSNGANIASALLLLRPDLLAGAILFRAMVPLVPDRLPALSARVLISNGRADPLVSEEETARLASLLKSAGADVQVAWQPGGHQLSPADVTLAREWWSRAPTQSARETS